LKGVVFSFLFYQKGTSQVQVHGAHLADNLSGCHLNIAFLYALRQDRLLMLSVHFAELSWWSIMVSCCANAAMMPAVPPRMVMDWLHWLASYQQAIGKLF